MTDEATLSGRGISVAFEGVKALEDVNISLVHGEILGLIGPNGAGKTTLLNVLSGFQPPTSGSVFLDGCEITGWPANRMARAGIGRSFQGARVFPELTVLENVEAGVVGMGGSRRSGRAAARELLARVGLSALGERKAGALSFGVERLVGVARALAISPTFLQLDEPAAGLDEAETDELIVMIAAIREDFECGVLLVEHDMRVIMRSCDRIQVLDRGRTLKVGRPSEIRDDSNVIAAYLGESVVDVDA